MHISDTWKRCNDDNDDEKEEKEEEEKEEEEEGEEEEEQKEEKERRERLRQHFNSSSLKLSQPRITNREISRVRKSKSDRSDLPFS